MTRRDPLSERPEPATSPGEKLKGVLGLGLDDDGGHRRVTKGSEFTLVGGSAETHERMQDLVLRMRETLKRQGKKFVDIDHREFENLARDSLE